MPSRRQALRSGSLVAAALAGCLGSSGTTTTTDTSTTTTTSTTESPTTDTTTTRDATDALRWVFDADGGFERPPVVADGTVYAGADALHAVSTDGTGPWTFEADVPVQYSPLVRESGVYVVTGSYQGSPAGEKFAAHALDRDGSERWRHDADHGMVSVLDATSDTALVGTHDDHLQKEGESLYALDAATGDRQWEVGVGDAENGVVVDDRAVAGYRLGVASVDLAEGVVQWRTSAESLAGVAGDAVVVTGRSDVRSLALPDGTERWAFEPSSSPTSGLVVDGTVYVGTYDGVLHALDAESGEERWRASIGGKGYGSPAVTDDTVYVMGEPGDAAGDAVYALDPDTGEERWRFDTGERYTRLAAGADGAYVAAGGSLQALAPDSSERWRYDADARLTRPVVGADGVYVGDKSGTLAALQA